MTKQCRKCKKIKTYSAFDKHEDCQGGVVGTCKICRKEYQLLNKDRDNTQRRKRYAKDPSKVQEQNAKWAKTHKKETAERLRNWARKNRAFLREYHRNYSAAWRDENRGLVNAKAATYRAARMNQTPKWLSEEQKQIIRAIYDQCPKGYEVDHIIPLQHSDVRGLHVPWNLQYLPMSANRSKGNRIKPSQE